MNRGILYKGKLLYEEWGRYLGLLWPTRHIVRIMKFTAILTVVFTFQVSAFIFGQNINLSYKNASLKTVINAISSQGQIDFVYKEQFMENAKPVTIELNNGSIEGAIKQVFSGQPFQYHIEDGIVYITPRHSKFIIEQNDSPATQQQELRIRVLNPEGEPLVGASIYRVDSSGKRSTVIATTDENGYFTVDKDLEGSSVEVYHVGYSAERIVASERTKNITLSLQLTEVEEVEIVLNTGYQQLPKERATGSFGVVSKSQIEKPTLNIGQRLIGTMGGVQANLDVDGNPTFEIRGQTSLIASAEPLVVVDGFPIQGGFNSINPNDVESMTVLKDAAAASIWGARAGNGVIVITTKSGSSDGRLSIDFQAFTRVGSKLDLDYVNPLASSSETIDYEMMSFNKWSAQENNGSFEENYNKSWSLGTTALSEHYLGNITETERDDILNKLRLQDNRQQIRDNLLSNPVDQQYNLSIHSTTERMRNSFSLMFNDSQSNFKETGRKQVLLTHRSGTKVFEWLDFNTSITLQYHDQKQNGVSLSNIQQLSPYEMLRGEGGELTNIHQYYWPIMERNVPMSSFPYSDWTYNPISEIRNRDLNQKDLNARLMGGLVFKPLEGINFESSIQYETFHTFTNNHYYEGSFYVRDMVNTATFWDRDNDTFTPNLPEGGILDQSRVNMEAYTFRNQLSVNKDFSDRHQVNFVAGTELSSFLTNGFINPTTYGYNDETLTIGKFPNGPGGDFYQIKNWLGNNQTFDYTSSYTSTTERFFSLYGNAAYTLDRKYTVSASARTDASNLITDDPKYRYAPMWSVGGSWQMGREEFMQSVSWVDNLGVRLTYGFNGNVDKSTAFMPLVNMNTTPNSYTNDIFASVSSYGNPTLRWEKTGTVNLGVDFFFLQGKLFGKLDLYNKHGKDLIAELSIPSVNGTTTQKLNNAEMVNRGIEIELGTRLPIKGDDISWMGNLAFSYNKNEITSLFVSNYIASDLTDGGTRSYVEGYDANSMWMFRYAGVHNTQPMIHGEGDALYDFGQWTPGDGRDFMVNTGTKVAPYTIGLMNSFKIYDFDFSFIFTGKLGHVFKKSTFNYPTTWNSRVLPNKHLSDVINSSPDQMVPLPFNDIEDRYYFWDRFLPYLDYVSANASHFRLQEVNLTYHLPTTNWSLLNKSRLMVYAQGNDLFTVLFNKDKEDPEYPIGTIKPLPKFTFGVKASF